MYSIELLILSCFDLVSYNRHLGKLPLHVAISLHSRSCTRWRQILLQYPCAIHLRDDDFLYPFMIASKYSFVDVAFELLCAAPDVMMEGLEHLMPLNKSLKKKDKCNCT